MTNLLLLLAVAAGPNATVTLGDAPYRAIGINYFDSFLRTLKNGEDTSYTQGFATLAAKKIPFVRFCATGYWPIEMKLYQENRDEYFRRLDAVVECAQQHHIGLVPSLFWNQEHKGTWDLDAPEQFRDVLARAHPDPVDAISLHAYENDDERLADAQIVARQLNKPLFVGEFGSKGQSPEEAAKFRRLLDSIIKSEVPLAAAWVFDYPNQPEFNITAENARSWMLDAIAEANRALPPPTSGF